MKCAFFLYFILDTAVVWQDILVILHRQTKIDN